jgi:transcriptional regulator with XRE-family HTH domain
MNTYEIIKKLADNKGITLQKTATELGLSINAIYKWKTQAPKGKVLLKVADYFDVSVDYLLGREEKEVKKIDLKYDNFPLFFGGEEITDTERQMINSLIETYLKNKTK